MRQQRILIHGDLVANTGAWCYARAFERAGYIVDSFSVVAKLEAYQKNLALRIYRRLFHTIRPADRRRHVAALLAKVDQFHPTIFISLRGDHLSACAIDAIRRKGAWTANVNHDDFFSSYRSNWTWTQRRAIPAYDQILTTRWVNVEEIRPLNPNVQFFPFAYDPHTHHPVPIPASETDRWNVDVVFVGQWALHRAGMLDKLVAQVPARYAIHGPHWDRLSAKSPSRKFVNAGPIWGDDMAKALGGAKIALGFLRKENRDDYTQRTFEIPACGGLLVAERTARHQSFFREGVEAEYFDSDRPEELISKVRMLLADNDRRQSLRDAGIQALKQGAYTYDDRVQEILALVELAGTSQ